MTTKEKYYAVRIGRPKVSFPYFMVIGNGNNQPQLFCTREEAEVEMKDRKIAPGMAKVLRVTLHDGRCA